MLPHRYRITLAVLLAAPLAIAAETPRRIVSTSPSVTEILFALGLGNRVVGVTNYCHYPPEVKKLPKVGTYLQPNLEVIAGLKPDLVVLEKNPIQLSNKVAALGLKSVEVDPNSLAGIYTTIEKLGEATGTQAQARALAARIRGDLEAVKREAAKRPRRTVVFVIGRTPGALEGLVVVGRSSYLNDLMSMAGGDNVFRDANAPYPPVPFEEVLSRNPEVVLDMGDMSDPSVVSEQHKKEVPRLWQRYPSLRAAREGHVYAIASDIYVVPGPRVVDAAREFARMFGSLK